MRVLEPGLKTLLQADIQRSDVMLDLQQLVPAGKKVYDITPIASPDNYDVLIKHFDGKANAVMLLRREPRTEILFAVMQHPGDIFVSHRGQSLSCDGQTPTKDLPSFRRMLLKILEPNTDMYDCVICYQDMAKKSHLDRVQCKHCAACCCTKCYTSICVTLLLQKGGGQPLCPVCRQVMKCLPDTRF